MPTKTRGYWVEFETGIRKSRRANKPAQRLIKESERFWASLGAIDQKRFLWARKEYLEYSQRFQEYENDAQELQNEADSIHVHNETDWPDYIQKYEAVSEAWVLANRYLKDTFEKADKQLEVIDGFSLEEDEGEGNWGRATPAHADVVQHARDEAAGLRRKANAIDDLGRAAQRKADFPPIAPPRPDGRLKLPKEWVSEFVRTKEKTRRWDDFVSGKPGETDGWNDWRGAWALAQGGMSMTGLWVRLDEAESVVDRVVRKNTYCSAENWKDFQQWTGNLRDPNNRLPCEIAFHQKMDGARSDLQDERQKFLTINVPHLRAYHVDNERLMYSMSMEFCPFQSLSDLIVKHEADERRMIPEPFIWRTFHSLAEVGLAMEKGNAIPGDPPPKDYQEIVHRDIKPLNVFLAAPTKRNFESYPTPKLSDFGLALLTSEDDPFNPNLYVDTGGTPGFLAPEQTAYVSPADMRPIDRFKLLAHTNVWAVGMTIWALGELDARPEQAMFLGTGEGNWDDINWDVSLEGYSDHLKKLVRDCLRFNPENRPDWEEVLERIDEAMNESGLDLGKDLRLEQPVKQDHAYYLMYLPADAYAIGLAFQDLPAMNPEKPK